MWRCYILKCFKLWLVRKGEEIFLADSGFSNILLAIDFFPMHRNLLNTGQKGNLNFRKSTIKTTILREERISFKKA